MFETQRIEIDRGDDERESSSEKEQMEKAFRIAAQLEEELTLIKECEKEIEASKKRLAEITPDSPDAAKKELIAEIKELENLLGTMRTTYQGFMQIFESINPQMATEEEELTSSDGRRIVH